MCKSKLSSVILLKFHLFMKEAFKANYKCLFVTLETSFCYIFVKISVSLKWLQHWWDDKVWKLFLTYIILWFKIHHFNIYSVYLFMRESSAYDLFEQNKVEIRFIIFRFKHAQRIQKFFRLQIIDADIHLSAL